MTLIFITSISMIFGLIFSLTKIMGFYNKNDETWKYYFVFTISLIIWIYYLWDLYWTIQLKIEGRINVIVERFHYFMVFYISAMAYKALTLSFYDFLVSFITLAQFMLIWRLDNFSDTMEHLKDKNKKKFGNHI